MPKNMLMMRILAATGGRQDEAEIRAADRMAADRTVACAELKSRMAKNSIYCRQHFADAKRTVKRFEEDQASLEAALSEADEAKAELKVLQENAVGDVAIEEKRPLWNDAIAKFMKAAEGERDDTDNDNASTDELSRLLCEHLLLGEPSSLGAAVVLYHPVAPKDETVRVVYATDKIDLQTGQNLRYNAKKNTALAAAVLEVIKSGNPVLSNPHAVAGDEAISIVPLYSSQRSIFGAIQRAERGARRVYRALLARLRPDV